MGEPKVSLADVALHARDLILDGKWVQREPIQSRQEICAVYALLNVTGKRFETDLEDELWLFREAAGIPERQGTADWNDHPVTTKEEVVAAFDEMARLAKERGL
jgi:hypothetical protein